MKLTEIHSNGNIRKDLGDLKDLSESIKAQGLIEPLVVKKNGNGYILIAGHRRMAASKMAGLTDVPVHIIEIKDEDIEGVQLAENLHRKDLSPSEICQVMLTELKRRGFTLYHDGIIPAGLDEMAEEIALKTGAKKNYIKQMARLAFLPPFFAKLLKNDNLPVVQALAILQLPPEAQSNLEKNYHGWHRLSDPGDYVTTSDLERFINRTYGTPLNKAPFPLDQPIGEKLPCLTCAYNTSNTTELFPVAGVGICRLSECFKSKCQTISTELKAEFLDGFDKKVQGLPKFEGYFTPQLGYGEKQINEIKGLPVVKKDGDAFFVGRAGAGRKPQIYQVNTRASKKGKDKTRTGQRDERMVRMERPVTEQFVDELLNTPALTNLNQLKVTPKHLLTVLDDDMREWLGKQKAELTFEMIARAFIFREFQRDNDNAADIVGIDREKAMDDVRKKLKTYKKQVEEAWHPKQTWDSPPQELVKAVAESIRSGKPLAYAAPVAAAPAQEIEEEEEDNE